MKPFPQLSIDIPRLLSLGAIRTPLRSRDVDIKPIYSVGVTSSVVLRNEVQYQTAVFLLSIETNPGLLWFCRKIAPASQQIECKTESNCGLVIHVFTRFTDFEYLLVVSNSNRVSKATGTALAFLHFALWLVSKTHISTNQIQNETHPRLDHSEKFASRALHLTVSFLLLSDVIAQYAGTLCMVSSRSNFSDSGNRGFKPRWWIQARILRYRVLKLSASKNVYFALLVNVSSDTRVKDNEWNAFNPSIISLESVLTGKWT